MELAGCYELLGEQDNLAGLYLKMMRDCAPNSNEYKYAEASLNLSDLKLKKRNPNGAPQPDPEGVFAGEQLADGISHPAGTVTKLSRKGAASGHNRGA